jgi:hypothetical protein
MTSHATFHNPATATLEKARHVVEQIRKSLRYASGEDAADLSYELADWLRVVREREEQTRGDWMQTFTGRRFYPMDPRPEEVDPADIAHALSLLCRYGGHLDRFYSVAEHCVLMSEAVAPEHALAALLHDATEAYVCDVPRPLKRYLPEYRSIEDAVRNAICLRFRVAGDLPAEVKDADNRIILTERNALMSNAGVWAQDGVVEPLPVAIVGWSPAEAELVYRGRLDDLLAARVPDPMQSMYDEQDATAIEEDRRFEQYRDEQREARR